MKQTLNETVRYINSIKLSQIPSFFFSCIFLGWNGIQIIFSLGLILTFIDSKSIFSMVFNSMRYGTQAIPTYIFALTTIFFVHWILHCFFESRFITRLQGSPLNFSELKAVSINFFIPNLTIVLTIVFIVAAIFILLSFGLTAFSGLRSAFSLSIERSIYIWLKTSITVSIAATILLTDNVLPRMVKNYSFKGALYRAYVTIKKKPFQYFLFYLFKLALIILSILVFQSILKHFFLPYFLLIEDKYSFSVLLFSGKMFNFKELFLNVLILYGIIISSYLIFTPIIAFPYIYQRLLLYKWSKH